MIELTNSSSEHQLTRDEIINLKMNVHYMASIESVQIVDGILYLIFLGGFSVISWVSVKTIINVNNFKAFKLVVFYFLLLGMFLRYMFVSTFDMMQWVPSEKGMYRGLLAGFLFSRMLMYTSYSLLLILWVRLYHNVFKVKQAIFKLKHFTTYVFLFVHLCFVGIFIPILIYPENSDIFSLFYNNIYILFIIIYAGFLGIGFTLFGFLLWRNSKNTGKVDLNDRILIISIVLFSLIVLLDGYLIYAFLNRGDQLNLFLYRSLDSIVFVILMVGLSLLLNRKPATRKSKKENSSESGSTETHHNAGKSCEINMDVRKVSSVDNPTSPTSISQSIANSDGIYSHVEEVSIEFENQSNTNNNNNTNANNKGSP